MGFKSKLSKVLSVTAFSFLALVNVGTAHAYSCLPAPDYLPCSGFDTCPLGGGEWALQNELMSLHRQLSQQGVVDETPVCNVEPIVPVVCAVEPCVQPEPQADCPAPTETATIRPELHPDYIALKARLDALVASNNIERARLNTAREQCILENSQKTCADLQCGSNMCRTSASGPYCDSTTQVEVIATPEPAPTPSASLPRFQLVSPIGGSCPTGARYIPQRRKCLIINRPASNPTVTPASNQNPPASTQPIDNPQAVNTACRAGTVYNARARRCLVDRNAARKAFCERRGRRWVGNRCR